MTSLLVNADTLHIPLADKSVHCIVTSPPYWSLRDYGIAGQLGLEKLHDCLGWATGNDCGECYICRTRAWARECWRVLRDDGTMWVNIGDSYNSAPSWGRDPNDTSSLNGGKPRFRPGSGRADGIVKQESPRNRNGVATFGLKSKDLCMIPARLALALQADGWYLRSDIIWSKPNPMPESVTDRCTKSHEYIFLLSKAAHYYFDNEAIKEPNETTQKRPNYTAIIGNRTSEKYGAGAESRRESHGDNGYINPAGRNRRSVWTINTHPYKEAHFATYPPKLVEPCILAGTSERGACPKCGKPWVRVVEKESYCNVKRGSVPSSFRALGQPQQAGVSVSSTTIGFRPACTCDAGDPVPATVCDVFAGSGTTGVVCQQLGRNFIGLDLSYTYLHDNARERLSMTALDEWVNGKKDGNIMDDLPLFNLEVT